MTAEKNPHDTIFWNDLENDEKLKACSWTARGLWACKLLPIAARSIQRGVIIIGGHPCRWDGDLPGLLAIDAGAGGDPEVVKLVAANFLAMLTELVTSGAASVDERGRLFNRRMVRLVRLSEVRSQAGKTGAAARWQTDGKHHGKQHGKKSADPRPLSNGEHREIPEAPGADGCEGDGKTMHSSSFNASSRESLTEDRGATRAKRASSPSPKLTVDWAPSEDLRQWTVDTLAATNATDRVSIDRELLKFRTHHVRKGTTQRGATAAWHTWIFNAIDWSERDGSSIGRKAPASAGTRAAQGYAYYAAVGAGQLAKRRPPGDEDDPA